MRLEIYKGEVCGWIGASMDEKSGLRDVGEVVKVISSLMCASKIKRGKRWS